MSGEKRYTEREVIVREREAVRRAVAAVWDSGRGTQLPYNWEGTEKLSARLYPLPKVTRPRTAIGASGHNYRVLDLGDGRIGVTKGLPDFATRAIVVDFPLADIDAITNLLANPTEEVEE